MIDASRTTDSSMPWPVVLFLLAVFYVAEPMNIGFSASETLHPEELQTAERIETNIQEQAGGRRGRQAGMLLLAGFGVWCIWSSADRLRLSGGVAALISLFAIWIALSALWSDEPFTTLKKAGVLGCLSIGALGLAVRYSHAALLSFVIRSLLMLTLAGLGAELALRSFRPWESEYRFSGVNWPAFSAWCLSLLVIGILTRWPQIRRRRQWWAAVLAAAVGLLILTKTRASAAGLVAGIGMFLMITWPRKKLARAALALSICGPALWLGAELVGLDPAARFFSVVNLGREQTASGISGRGELWSELTSYVADRPLLGYGYESFWTAERLYDVGSTHWGAPDAHNGFLNLALGTGLFGTALYCFVLAAALAVAVRQFSDTGDRFFAFSAAAIVVLAVNAMFVATQLSPALYGFITLVVILRLGLVALPQPSLEEEWPTPVVPMWEPAVGLSRAVHPV